MKLRKIDLQNNDHLRFVYDVRCHPKVDRWLFGLRPVNYDVHVEYLKKSKKEKVFIIYEDI